MRAPILVLIIVVAAATGCAKKPILEIDNPWSGNHIAVTSIRPGLVDSIFREGLVIEFDVTPPSGDGPTLRKDFVTVWQALEPQADASGFDAVMMTAPNAATSYAKAIFVKKSGAWLIFDRGEWIPPSAIKPMLRDFGPVATYSLRSTKRPLLGLNATAFVPYRADHGPAGRSDAEIVVSTFPYPL